jgi:hypothetical protein
MTDLVAATSSGSFDREEVIKRAKEDLNFLAALCMPGVFTLLFPAIHLALWALMIEKVSLEGFFRLLLALPRGHAKTTLVKLFVLYCVLFTDRNFILIICASAPKAEAFLSDVADMLSEPNIINIFGNWQLAAETNNTTTKVFSFLGREIVLMAAGQGSIRGINIKHRRPDLIIFDDVQDKENAESETESKKLLNWIQATAMKLRSPHRCFFIYIGNKYKVSGECVCILERMQQNPLWTSIVTGAFLSDGEPLWPELHSRESLLEEFQNDFNMGVPEIFLAEIMNDTEANFNALIDVSKIPMSPFDDDEILCQGRFVTIDVATNKIGADDTAIALHGIYPTDKGEKTCVEDLDEGSLSPKETIEKALNFCFSRGATVIGVESTAYQYSLLFWFDFFAKELGVEGIQFVEIKHHGKKNARLIGYLKQLLKGESYLGRKVRAKVFSQALAFKPNKTNNRDDILDTAADWQQMMELYRHLIALPGALLNQEYGATGVVENNSCF